jgi:broad specificity phosphatase PhoE
MVNYVLIGRHGERVDFQNPTVYTLKQMKSIQNEWLNSKRYKENPYDPAITKFGKDSSKKLVTHIHNKFKFPEKIVLYSSPFTRCIMTAGGIQQQLKKYGYTVPIRVEYGLSEAITLPELVIYNEKLDTFEYKQINDTTLLYGKGKNNDENLDEKMKLHNIFKRFPEYIFDKKYIPIMSYQKSMIQTFPDYANRLMKVSNQIISENPDTFVIMIGHADLVRFGHNYYISKHLNEEDYNSIYDENGFGSFFLFKMGNGTDIKLLDFKKNNLEYNKDLPNQSNKKIYILISIMIIIILLIIILKCKK